LPNNIYLCVFNKQLDKKLYDLGLAAAAVNPRSYTILNHQLIAKAINHRMKYILLVLVFIVGLFRTSLSGQDSLAQVEEPRKFIEKSSLIVLPLAFYTPETRFGGGVGGLYAFRFGNEPEESRPSQVELGLAYTQNEQILLYLLFSFTQIMSVGFILVSWAITATSINILALATTRPRKARSTRPIIRVCV
jgi:hypothetical protein